MKLVNNVIKLSYINTPKFKELTSDEKERFENKFTIIHDNLPVNRNLSLSLNKIINDGLYKLVKENKESFINGFYTKFVDQLIIRIGAVKMKNHEYSYSQAFNFNSQEDIYNIFNLFINYFESMHLSDIGITLPLLELDDNNTFYQLWVLYHTLSKENDNDYFNMDIIRYLFMYFLSHNELIKEYKLFYDIVKRLIDDKELADYYRMNYQDNIKDIPNDLIKRFNENNKIIIR